MQKPKAAASKKKTQPAPPKRNKLLIPALAALLLVGAGVAAAFFLLRPPQVTPSGTTNGIHAAFVMTEAADGVGAPPASPLVTRVRLLWKAGDNSTVVSSVGIEFLDDRGNPAIFGGTTLGPADMKPALDVADWFYEGSTPTEPGTYHARITLKRLFGDGTPETVDLVNSSFRVVEENTRPITEGYVMTSGSDLWLLSPGGDRHRRITFFGTGESGAEPVWSPDGKRIAFTYTNKNFKSLPPPTEIRVMAGDGTGMVSVVGAEPGTELAYPAWSPDGSRIFYTVRETDGETGQPRTRISEVTPATRASSPVTEVGTMPHTTADGTMVYVEETVDEGQGSVLRYRLVHKAGDAEARTLVEPGTFPAIYFPRPSPDGKWVAFAAVNRDQLRSEKYDFWAWLTFQPRMAEAHGAPWDVYMVPTTGGEVTRLTTINDDEPRITWLDNSLFAFNGVKGIHTQRVAPDGKPQGDPVKIHKGSDHGGLSWYGDK
jgi:hypothetical protein